MDDIPSWDDEKGRELSGEKGLKEEWHIQRERECNGPEY
jgi:hypothetical protein